MMIIMLNTSLFPLVGTKNTIRYILIFIVHISSVSGNMYADVAIQSTICSARIELHVF